MRKPSNVRPERRVRIPATASVVGRGFCAFALITMCVSCNRFGHYTLVSTDYGFSVTFPERPLKQSDKNHDGLPKHLWTLYRNDFNDFYSAQATSYKEALRTEGWVPGQAVGDLAGIELIGGRRYKLRSATGREATAVATTEVTPAGGTISTIYIIDGCKLISITARTDNTRDKTAFLESLKLL